MIIIPRYMTMLELAAWLECEFPGKCLRYVRRPLQEVRHA